ncbi:MAG TPA: GTP-binding protein [Archaeoglobus veneficus]|nr:GTP-binding protein [Archaeoglobus veneficus]
MRVGIPVLDDVLGSLPKGKTLTYYIDPEVEGDVFAMQTLYTNLEEGYRCAYVTSTMSPSSVRNRFREFGWELNDFPGFSMVDAYSGFVGSVSEERYVVRDPSNPSELDEVIKRAIRENDLVVIGAFSAMIDLCGEDFIRVAENWTREASNAGSRLVLSFVAWPYGDDVLEKVKDMSNAVVTVGGVHHRVVLGYYYGLLKADWADVNGIAVLFRLVRPGGVRAYIPKILVTGPFNAGKSSFVHAVSNKAVSVDRLGTTVALDHGHVEFKGFSIDIFGTPGQERFDPLLKVLGKEALGVILVVDSANPETFPRAKQMLEATTRFGLPYVIAANKQDLPNALSPEEIRKRMALPENIPIVPIVAKDGKGVYDVLEALLRLLIGGKYDKS